MKHYHDTIVEDGYEYDVLICELTSLDVSEAKEEYRRYMNKSGKIYERDVYKNPCLSNFFELYFGLEDYDIYVGEAYETPSRYILPDEDATKEFFNMANGLKYHDRFNQTYCDVELNGNFVDVYYGDY